MGAELYRTYPEARAVFEQADDVLGMSLSRLCFEGPEEMLNDTANTQPAIYASSMALWAALLPRLEGASGAIAMAAGHSLGEFSALTATGALSLADGLRLVRRRGEAMRDAGASQPGGMAAIVGLDDEAVAQIVAEANGDEMALWLANYNAPGQVVIAGRQDKLEQAQALAKARQARMTVPLAVSVACHTPYMRAAAERLGAALAETTIQRPWAPVVSNALALPLVEPADIQAALLQQLYSPVRWAASVQAMDANGVTASLEVGPKAVVSGLVRRIARDWQQLTVTDGASLEALDVEAMRV
jgi:[acyl-carrier-protein] S-malonyltransferase